MNLNIGDRFKTKKNAIYEVLSKSRGSSSIHNYFVYEIRNLRTNKIQIVNTWFIESNFKSFY